MPNSSRPVARCRPTGESTGGARPKATIVALAIVGKGTFFFFFLRLFLFVRISTRLSTLYFLLSGVLSGHLDLFPRRGDCLIGDLMLTRGTTERPSSSLLSRWLLRP